MATLPEPAWGDAQDVNCNLTAVLKDGVSRPSQITGYVLWCLRAHFYTAENIADPALKELIWRDDATDSDAITSKVLIRHVADFSPKDAEQRPAVLVRPGPMQSSQMALANKALTGLTADGYYEGESYMRQLNGEHAVICLARGGMAADKLVEEVYFALQAYAPTMRQDMRISNFQVGNMDARNKFEGYNDLYGAVIHLMWTAAYRWMLKPIAPILRKVGYISSIFEDENTF